MKVGSITIDSHMHINSIVLKNKLEYIEAINKNKSIKSIVNVGLNVESAKETALIS